MQLYLSSFKLGNKQSFLKDWANRKSNKLLLITNARDLKEQDEKEKEKIESYVKMLEDIGFNVALLDLKNYFNDGEKLYEDIRDYNAFCVTGGNVFVLRQAMKLSGFDKYLKDNRANSNMLYVSWSAGSCVLSDNLKGLDLVDEPVNPYNDDEIMYEGIGFLNYCLVPHYKSDHKESIFVDDVVEYMDRYDRNYVAISDGDVIIEEVF